MKLDLITLVVSFIVFLLAVASSRALLADPSAYTRYYIVSVLTISAVTALIAMLRMLIEAIHHRPGADDAAASKQRAEQRRKAYRLAYAHPPLPLFVQTGVQRLPTNAFSCPVKDISETGLSLLNTGVYAAGQIVHGTIIFPSGRTARVKATVIREEPDRTCMVLHSPIDPALIMTEQRALIDLIKNTGPRPAVSRSALAEPESSLPSHCPKGIRRVK